MVPFKLTTLGKELYCEQYGFTEDTIYKNKSFYDVFVNIVSEVMQYRHTRCTIVTCELILDNLLRKFKKKDLMGVSVQNIFKICDTTWLTELITMLNCKGINQIILIDTLKINRISELKQIDLYGKRNNISLIVREQVPYEENK